MLIARLILESATCSAMWSGLYARLCKKIMEQISPKVKANNNGFKHIVGGELFRKYLIIQCENAFKIGCITTASTTVGALEDGAFVAEENGQNGESVQKERRVLGLTMFMVELFKLQILTEVIMLEYIMTLLWGVDGVPESEEIVSFCNLLTIVGSTLDKAEAMSHMRAFLYRMEELMKNPQVTPRLQFMLLVYIVYYSNHLVIDLVFFSLGCH
jgi:translation initiation factor 4G